MPDPADLYLSRLQLNPRNRFVQANLADCHRLHRTLMDAFPLVPGETARAEFGLLYRPEVDPRTGVVTVFVQSNERPDWSTVPGRDGQSQPFLVTPFSPEFDLKSLGTIATALAPAQRLRFRLRANPTKRLAKSTDPACVDKLAGKRVGLLNEEDQLCWLERKIAVAGARLVSVATSRDPLSVNSQRGRREDDRHGKPHRMTFQAVLFDGVMEVSDPTLLWDALRHGIGPGKAYGFGLLSLAPA